MKTKVDKAREDLRLNVNDCLQAIYLEWANDWISIEKFAEYYAMEVSDAEKLIAMARNVHDHRCPPNGEYRP